MFMLINLWDEIFLQGFISSRSQQGRELIKFIYIWNKSIQEVIFTLNYGACMGLNAPQNGSQYSGTASP